MSIKLLAVGDIWLQTGGNKHPFDGVRNFFKKKDILFGNLETVLSDEGKEIEKAFSLHTAPEKVKYLKDVGFDVLNIANNHILDLGPDGFNETLEVLDRNELPFIGAGNRQDNKPYEIVEREGIRVGFLGYHEYFQQNLIPIEEGIFVNKMDRNRIIIDIKDLRRKCDVVAVSLHWGTENVFYPSPKQIELARNLVDAGAALILGHHPHVLQGVERYKDGLIAYSLGNFQFNSEKESRKDSIILSVDINKNGVENYEIVPVKIDTDYVPNILTGSKREGTKILMDTISHSIVEGKINEKWWFEEIAYEHLRGNMESWMIRIKKYGLKHFLQYIKWLLSPSIVKCYLGLLRRKMRRK